MSEDVYSGKAKIKATLWWLRSPGNSADCAANVDNTGSVNLFGCPVKNTWVAVRPAVMIRLK